MESEEKTITDVLGVVRRRRWQMAAPALGVFLVASVVAFSLPKVYRSTSTILIEAQEIPREYVAANITSYADQRLQSINQRIMGTTKLLEIMNRFNLYADLKSKKAIEDIVEKMRKDIKFATISADVVDPRTGRPAQATIAFSVSYQGENPAVVHQVANELTSIYLEENLKSREKQSLETSKFMEDEMKSGQTKLAQVEAKIASYKEKHITSLPELSQVNLQGLDMVERDMAAMKDQLRALTEKEGYLQTQLTSIPSETVSQEKASLKELRTLLVDLKSRFSDEYPDVIKTRAAIADLEKHLNAQKAGPAGVPDNPAYVTLSSQLAGTRTEIESVRRQLGELAKKRDSYRSRMEATPRVEEGYKNLAVERNNLQAKYDDLTKKSMDANVAHGLEKGNLGERFSVVDAARLPEKPVSPNIPAILLIGLILGCGSGVGLVAIKESSDQSVRSTEELAKATSFPVLAGIAEIVTRSDLAKLKGRRKMAAAVIVLAVVAGVFLFNFFVMELDVFWAKAQRRFFP
jgi:polysaccharide biosynthesis transport protein